MTITLPQLLLLFAAALLLDIIVLVIGGLFVRSHWRRENAPPPIPELALSAEDVVDQGARVFDASNPPHYATYNPKNYDPDRAPHCTCHDRRVEQGDQVLIWPIPDHPEGGMDLFCKDTFGNAGVPH